MDMEYLQQLQDVFRPNWEHDLSICMCCKSTKCIHVCGSSVYQRIVVSKFELLSRHYLFPPI